MGNKDEPETAEASDDAPIPTVSSAKKLEGWRLALTMPCILIGVFLATIDSSIVSTALVTIGNDFENFIQTIWIVLGYLMSYMTFALLWPRLSDVMGRKWCFITASVTLFIFSLGCALSRSLGELIAFRVLQGLGGSGLYSLGNMILPEISPNRWYSYMLAAQGTIFTLAGILGPLMGGIIATRTTWRWIFYLNLPTCATIAVIMAFSWTQNKQTHRLRRRLYDASHYDFIGVALFTAATCCLVLGLELGGSSFAPWVSAEVLSLLCVSAVCFAAFTGWNYHRNSARSKSPIQPLFPSTLLEIRLVSASLIICTLSGFDLFMATVTIPQRFQVVNGDSALIAGVRLSPFLCASAIGSTTAGMIFTRRNYTFPIVLTSCSSLLLGACLLRSVEYGSKIDPRIYAYQVFYGLGTGGMLSSTGYIIGINSRYRDYAVASGVVSQVRIFGGCLGLTLSNLILNETFNHELRSILRPDQLQSLRQSLEYTKSLTQEQQRAVSDAFAQAFVWQFTLAACVAAAGIIVSFWCWTRHPVDLKGRLEIGDRVSKGEITPEDGDRLLREYTRT